MIAIIAAVAANRVIGHAGALPWHLPEDLRWFREQTMGHYLLMGRRTFESIGAPLPGRHTIVLSRTPGYSAPGCEVAPDLDTALRLVPPEKDLFVCGGGEIFHQTLSLARRLYLTKLDVDAEGETLFPEYDPDDFEVLHCHTTAGNIHQTYLILQRISPPTPSATKEEL